MWRPGTDNPNPVRCLTPCPRAAQIYFPTVYDIKYLMKFCDNLHGGLNKLAEVLDVDRIGPQHQARPTPDHDCSSELLGLAVRTKAGGPEKRSHCVVRLFVTDKNSKF